MVPWTTRARQYIRVVGWRSDGTVNDVRPSPSGTPVWLTATRNDAVERRAERKIGAIRYLELVGASAALARRRAVLHGQRRAERGQLVAVDGRDRRREPSASRGPDRRRCRDGAVGPTGTCACRARSAAAGDVQMWKQEGQGNSRINRSVVMYRPRYSSNNEPMVNLFIENRSVR